MMSSECDGTQNRPRRNPLRDRRGTSLLETFAAIVAVAVIVVASHATLNSEEVGTPARNNAAGAPAEAKISMDELKYHIRLAGRGVPPGLSPLEARNGDPDAVTVCYRLADYEATLATTAPRAADRLQCGSNAHRFAADDRIYLHDPSSGQGEWVCIAEVDVEKQILALAKPVSRSYGAASQALPLRQVSFYLNESDSDGALTVDIPGETPRVCAHGITDLQLRYRLKNGSVVDEPEDVSEVREILVALSGAPPIEAGTPRQSRTLAASIYLRNLGI